MRILIYDVETAQTKNVGSICSVGWILLDNDRIVDEGYSLIDPHCSFSRVNSQIHGITAADVEGAPCFADYWKSTLEPLMTSALVVAHSANFDLSATEQALFAANITDPGIDYLDTIPAIKALVNSPSYKLADLASLTHYEYDAHNAGEDVHALLHVLCSVRDLCGFEDIAAMLIRTPARTENTRTNTYVPKSISDTSNRYPVRTHCTENVQSVDCALQGMKICITGDFPGYERSDIERMIMEHGGKPTSSVSSKTDYLIVGTYVDPTSGKAVTTSKHKKAIGLIEQGGKIKIIEFNSFVAMINDKAV